jgi:hypothetical protein
MEENSLSPSQDDDDVTADGKEKNVLPRDVGHVLEEQQQQSH